MLPGLPVTDGSGSVLRALPPMSSGHRPGPPTVTTYVLIHGAGDSGWAWHLLAAQLRERGHDVVAPDLPSEDDSAGFAAYADAVVEAIGRADARPRERVFGRRDLVVVAHSLGGFTGPLVCARVPVDLLVLLTAMVPAPGERPGDWWAATGFHGPDGDDVAVYLHDVPSDLAAEALARSRGQSGTPMDEPWPLDAWPDVPTRYLLCRDDRFFTPDFVRRMVRERLGIEPDEVDGSHCVMLSRPVELAEALEKLRAG
jgi:pimeloyl-ACP methyl ester carboxylesterase